jgi:hypothetical protein
LPMANATIPWVWWTWYVPPSNASNTFVLGNAYSWCNWKLPCYNQFTTTYNWSSCAVWCVPTAYATLFWYYDRKWTFPNLIAWTASTLNSTDIQTLMSTLWQSYMSTICSWAEWLTSTTNWMNWGVNYAKSKWYANTIWTAFTTNIFSNIKTEINASRPVILWNWSHAMVWYWYYSTTDTSKQIIRVNLWYWPLYNVTNAWWTVYYWSSIDYNVSSLYYNSSTQPWISTLVKIIVSN